MSKFSRANKVPGATEEERAILSNLRKIDVKRGAPVSRWMYDSFLEGNLVPDFVRERIEQYLQKKSLLHNKKGENSI